MRTEIVALAVSLLTAYTCFAQSGQASNVFNADTAISGFIGYSRTCNGFEIPDFSCGEEVSANMQCSFSGTETRMINQRLNYLT